jgi:hypothetical protein
VAYLCLVGLQSPKQARTEDNRMSVYVIAQGKIDDRALLDHM